VADSREDLRFGQASEVFRVNPSAINIDFRNSIDMRLAQLDAALMAIYGEGFDSFKCMSERHQDDYLWMLHGMVEEVRDLMTSMDRAEKNGGRHG
jgi:hypothetical protein